MSLKKERRPKGRPRGRGTVIKEFRAIGAALLQQEQEERGNTPKNPEKSLSKLAEVETPYYAVNNVRYLGICGLCEFPITAWGRCLNPECGQEWGSPKELTDELVSKMIARAKAALHTS